jgi:hypothetical protein
MTPRADKHQEDSGNDAITQKTGLPTAQWASLMITIIAGLFGGYYTLDKRISLIEQDNKSQSTQQAALQEVVHTGMNLRIKLQADVLNLQKTVDTGQTENRNDHKDIISKLDRIVGYKQMSVIKTEPDFVR